MSGLADLVEGVNQCVLVVGLERYMEVDGGAFRRVTHGDPIVRDDIPLVLYEHMSPNGREGRLGTNGDC